MGIKIITAPSSTPISVAEAKANSRVDASDEDSQFARWIKEAVALAENYMRAAIMQRRVEQTVDAFPDAEVEIELPPAWNSTTPVAAPIALVSLTYVDSAGATQTVATTDYTIDDTNWPFWMLPAFDFDWPETQGSANDVRVRYDTGYASAADVPEDILGWLLAYVDHKYHHRGAVLANGKTIELPTSFFGQLDPYRVFKV